MEENKKVNKLKKFVEDHEDVIVIAGCAVGVAAGVGLICLGLRKPKNAIDIAFENNMETLFKICKYVDEGTRSTEVFKPTTVAKTVAEFFGDKADAFLKECPHIQPDDTIANIIINIAKKAET